jgi:hypothetical protein
LLNVGSRARHDGRRELALFQMTMDSKFVRSDPVCPKASAEALRDWLFEAQTD